MVLATTALLGIAGSAQAQTLIASDDTYGVPFNQALEVEAFGVLDNDTLDGEPAGENGATAELISNVSHGTLSCPTDTLLDLCADGSFTYAPGPGFSGTDTFIYQAVSGAEIKQAAVTLTACSGGPMVFTCWQESSYLTKLAELGYSTFQEGFENDAVWGSVRSSISETNSAPSVTSMGITWETNHPAPPALNEITTGNGPARTGQWGVYDSGHGYASGTTQQCDEIVPPPPVPPPECLFKDGFTGTRQSGTLYGVGGFITGTTGANIAVILDVTNRIGLGKLPDPGHYFFSVIDTTGFTTFRVEETDGKVGQLRLVFGDDFTFGTRRSMPWIPLLLLDD